MNIVMPTMGTRNADGANARGDGSGYVVAHTLTQRYDSSEDGCGRGVPLVAQASDYKEGEYEIADVARPITTSADRTRAAPISLESIPRRLTPRECERLQGFPDDWTAVDGMKNGPRYRMMGNAVTVNVAEWIGRRIVESDTMKGDEV